MKGQTNIQYFSCGCFNIAIKISEKKIKIVMAKIETRKEIVRATTAKFAASLLFFVINMTVSYFPVEITLIIAVIEEIIASRPNSAGVNSLVRIGENKTGIACEMPVPTVSINDFRANPFLFESESKIGFIELKYFKIK